jgi:hypothetical protein
MKVDQSSFIPQTLRKNRFSPQKKWNAAGQVQIAKPRQDCRFAPGPILSASLAFCLPAHNLGNTPASFGLLNSSI